MARKFEEISIAGVEGTFLITQLQPTKAYYLLLDIVALVAPSAAKGLGGGTQGLDLGKMDLSQLGAAFESLFSRGNREEVKRITKELFSTVQHVGTQTKAVDDKSIDFIFAGNPLGIFELQRETLRVNFADFFGALVERLRPLLTTAKAKAASKALGTSAGQSGDSSPSESQP